MRPWIVAMVVALAVGPLLGAARPVSSAAPAATAAGTPDAFGVDLPAGPAGAAPAGLADGVTYVRATADWGALEPARGKFAWGGLDAQVRRAQAAHLHLVLVLARTPQWAALEPTAPQPVWNRQPPKNMADWVAFVRAAAQRYRGSVAAWQVEPSLDLAEFRGTTQDYRTMLHAVRQEVRRADPNALVAAASPSGLDLPYLKLMLTQAGGDLDAIVLYPNGRAPAQLLEALGTARAWLGSGRHHEFWLDGAAPSAGSVQIAASALAGGVTREFWHGLEPGLTTTHRLLGGARFVGALNRGPDTAVLVFRNGADALVVAWTGSESREIPLTTVGPPAVIGSSGQSITTVGGSSERSTTPSGPTGTLTVGPVPVFVTNPDPSLVKDAAAAEAQGPPLIPVAPERDFSKAPEVSAQLGAANVEHGLYNQQFRAVRSGAVVPVTVDGQGAVRTDAPAGAVYVYFNVDDSFAYFVDGRYDLVITLQVHRASAAQRVGFNLMYDSMTGYRFSPWQWVDAGDGWATYTVRLTDAAFAKTWGWDFAVNAAGDQKEPLVVRSVSVARLPPGGK